VALNCGGRRTIQALPRFQLSQKPSSGIWIRFVPPKGKVELPRWRAGHYVFTNTFVAVTTM